MSAGRTAFVTGAGTGIGLAITEALARQGFTVYGVARDQARLQTALDKLASQDLAVHAGTCDVTSAESVAESVAAAVKTLGHIDVLVNNAGRGGGGEIAKLQESTWLEVLDTNLNGVFRVTHEVMANGGIGRDGYGRIINIASTGGKQGVIYASPYSASKHGVVGFTKAVGLELAKSGITVNAVCPGYVETDMAEKVRAGYADFWGVSTDEVLNRFNAKIPLGRYSTPDEVAGLVGYLVTDQAASITAQALNVCGGLGNY